MEENTAMKENMSKTAGSHNNRITVKDIALIGMMIAVIEVSKLTLQGIPNIELTSFWLIMFTLYFGVKVIFVVPVFILLEGCLYGFGIWWVMYLYLWPLLVLVTWLGRRKNSVWHHSIVSAIFGLFFGMLCSIPYFFMGWVTGGVLNGIQAAFAWWVAGIPWDIVHGVSNFVIMLVLYKPMKMVMERLNGKKI